MVTENPTTWGPAFWQSNYGYATFEDFYADAEPLLDGIGIGIFRPPTESLARAAWYAPGGGIGVYVAGRLVDAPADGVPMKNDGRSLAELRALQTQQENTVPTLIIPNAFQVSIQAEASGQPVVNVLGVTSASGTAAGAAAAVKAAWEGAGRPLGALTPLLAVRNYRAVDLSSPFGDIADLASTATGGSAIAGNLATMAASALVQWNGASRSRSTRGRMYLGPLLEGQVNADGRTLATATVTGMNTAIANLISSLASAGYPLAVLSRKNSQAYPVVGGAVSPIIATQRRRLR